jgi:hypothetical protein
MEAGVSGFRAHQRLFHQTRYRRVLLNETTGFGEGDGCRHVGVKSIVVLAPGTYRLLGTATDNGGPLSGVRVEVVSGPDAGTVTTADPHYAFWGLSGDVEILATKDGYREARRRITMTKDPERLDVELVPLLFGVDFAGIYTLTVTGAPAAAAAPVR